MPRYMIRSPCEFQVALNDLQPNRRMVGCQEVSENSEKVRGLEWTAETIPLPVLVIYHFCMTTSFTPKTPKRNNSHGEEPENISLVTRPAGSFLNTLSTLSLYRNHSFC